MGKALLISLLFVWPGAAFAGGDAQCDAKPFTLTKPKTTAEKPAKTATADPAKAKPVPSKPAPKAADNQAKKKPIADCKERSKG